MAQGCVARYRARNPRATPLYRLFEAHFDEVRGQWEERFERRCGFWRGFVDEQVRRPPISLERVQWGGEGVVHYRAKGGHDGRTLPPVDAAEAFDPADFVARVIMHIPEPRRHLVRCYGWYSNVSRGKRRNAGAERKEIPIPGPMTTISRPKTLAM